jgi:hypothetical protein
MHGKIQKTRKLTQRGKRKNNDLEVIRRREKQDEVKQKENDSDYIFEEDEDDEEEAGPEPKWIEIPEFERNIKLYSPIEKKQALKYIKDFIEEIDEVMEMHNTKVIDFEEK